ncbi:MAG: helix-turn-helix domain-containing protein [Bacteroidales bacterium]
METGRLIRELRIKKGMTQEELADKTEVSARTIQRIENGEVDPRAYTLQMIAKALEVDYSLFTMNDGSEDNDLNKTGSITWTALIYLSCMVPLVFPTVLIWHNKKNSITGLSHHYRTALSYQLTVLAVLLASSWIYWKVNQPLPLLGVLLANALFSVFNAIKVISGKSRER